MITRDIDIKSPPVCDHCAHVSALLGVSPSLLLLDTSSVYLPLKPSGLPHPLSAEPPALSLEHCCCALPLFLCQSDPIQFLLQTCSTSSLCYYPAHLLFPCISSLPLSPHSDYFSGECVSTLLPSCCPWSVLWFAY